MKLKSIIASITVVLALAVSGYAQHVITSGGTYTYADGDSISINTTQPVTLYHCTVISNASEIVNCIAGAQITIEDSTFKYNGSTPSQVIWLVQPATVQVHNCYVDGGSGVGSDGIFIYGPCPGEIYVSNNCVNNCAFPIVVYNCKSNPSIYITWNQITGDAQTPRNDQISVLESSGTPPDHLIYIYENFVECDPDAKNVPDGTGINGSDQGCAYVDVDSCTVENGNYGGITFYYGNGNTSVLQNSLCRGIGGLNPANYSGGISFGHTGDTQAGYCYNTQCGWWNPAIGAELNFYPEKLHAINGNSGIGKEQITLANEQADYQNWLTAASKAGQTIGDPRGGNPSPTWPDPSDFNF